MENLIANSVKKETIIKCTTEEMMKAFFEDCLIVWHDPNVNSQENQGYIAKMKELCEVYTFTEWEKASTFIKWAQGVFHVITSGTDGEVFVQEISENKYVCNIYVFCGNIEDHSSWVQKYKKIACTETELESVLYQVQQNLLEWYTKSSSLKLNLPAFAPVFNDGDKSQMNHLHRYLKVIPGFENREQAKNDFLALAKSIYSDERNLKLLGKFEKNYNEYNKEQALRWYTEDGFLYQLLNKCLRIATSDSIQYCRLLLRDIERAVKEQYQTKSKDFDGLLYRGAYLSQEEWLNLKVNHDKEIEMHGFLSVSKEKKIAVRFFKSDPEKKVFITIIVPRGPNIEEQGFAEVEEFSQFPKEKEVLFNVRSRFTVLETEDDYVYSGISKCRHLVLLYGAQGLRKFLTEQDPVHRVSIPSLQSVSCDHCSIQQISERILFVSLGDPKTQRYYCRKCIGYGAAPFLCLPAIDRCGGESYVAEIKGCLLVNSSPKQTPFYGYKCCVCQAKKHKLYIVCTDCEGKKWCEDCFNNKNLDCFEARHNFILETTPFTFWSTRMSANELDHLKFQSDLVHKDPHIFRQANMYFESHEYERAVECYSFYIQESEGKENDENLALSYNNIGLVYRDQGEHQKALDHYLKSFNTLKSIHKDVHPSFATCFINIGNIFFDQRKYKEALEFHLKSLAIAESFYGENHSVTAALYNNIGVTLESMANYNEAVNYYSKSLKIRRSVFGENHKDTAASYNNLGNVAQILGEYHLALESYIQALEIRKNIYGDNHPETAVSYNNLGALCQIQEDYNKALKFYSKALSIRKSIFGENHKDTAGSYQNIGIIAQALGNYDEAANYYTKSLNIIKCVSGDKHPDAANCYKNLGNVSEILGDHKKALEYYSKCLDINRSGHGDNHPEIASCYNNIGITSESMGDYKEALEYHLKALNIRRSFFEENHPSVIRSRNQISKLESQCQKKL